MSLSVWAGKSISANLGTSVEAGTPTGVNWDSQIADVAVLSADGTVRTLFNAQTLAGTAWSTTSGANFAISTVTDPAVEMTASRMR